MALRKTITHGSKLARKLIPILFLSSCTGFVTGLEPGQPIDLQAPTTPAFSSPAQGATAYSASFDFSWAASSDGAQGSGVVGYSWKLFDATNCSGSFVDSGTTSNTHLDLSISNTGQYSLQLKALDAAGNESASACSSALAFHRLESIKNFALGKSSNTSTPVVAVGDTVFFANVDATSGTELWKIKNGTPSLLKDIYPGPGSSNPSSFVQAGNLLFFVASDEQNASELWVSDGTSAGTKLVKVLDLPYIYGALGSNLIFTVNDLTYGRELWISDGTVLGTKLVKDINAGNATSLITAPDYFTIGGGKLYFAANDTTHGYELWVSDGTDTGTYMIKDMIAGTNSGFPRLMKVSGGILYFSDSSSNFWKSDGTDAGTTMLKASLQAAYLTDVNGTVYFSGLDLTHYLELWKSNGTAASTVMVKDINPGAVSSSPTSLTEMNGKLYFLCDDGTHGKELWTSDGSAAGTTMVKESVVGPSSSFDWFSIFSVFNNLLYFVIDDGVHGSELWQSDGTAVGTNMLKDINPNAGEGSTISSLTMDSDDLLYFSGSDGSKLQVWSSNGSESGTHPIDGTALNTGTGAGQIAVVGPNLMYLEADDGIHGPELWKSDGTSAGTTLVKDTVPGQNGGYPTLFTPFDSDVLFTSQGYLWRTDGSSAGTFSLNDVEYYIEQIIPAGSKVFFDGTDFTYGEELWSSDGTIGGTTLVKDVWSGFGGGANGSYGPWLYANGILLFAGEDSATGQELWKSDGTTAGTVMVKDINTAAFGRSAPTGFFNLNGLILFTADDGTHGRELWTTDGTAANTVLFKDINVGAASSNPYYFYEFKHSAYFIADDGVNGVELWKTDGTSGGTALVKDINPGLANALNYSGFFSTSDTLYFVADDGVHGTELWKSDGTPGGTVMVKDINPGSAASAERFSAIVAGNKVYFVADDGVHGREIWVSDGSAQGTQLMKDLLPGPDSSVLSTYGTAFGVMGNALYFNADQYDGGHLFKLGL